jgi:hypothetical protein
MCSIAAAASRAFALNVASSGGLPSFHIVRVRAPRAVCRADSPSTLNACCAVHT